MANLTYRQAIQQAPAGTTTKNATLTSQEIDGNFKSLNDELITKAPLVSPGFSGVPTAPTATAGTNTTQLATTAFVQTGLSGRQPLDAELTAISGLSANGLITRTGASTAESRSIAVSGTGLSVTNADGVAGNPTVTSNATAANTVSTIVARDASGNFSAATITAALAGNAATATKLATARTISLTGDVTGSVSFDGSANASITATVVDDSHNHIIANIDGLQTALDGKVAKDSNTGSATLPAGTTAQRSAVPVAGALRFNSTLMQFEGYDGTAWGAISKPDASLVSFQQAGTGAVATNVQSKLRETMSVFDFMTAAQIADVQANTASIDVTTALQNAINKGGLVFAPRGTYLHGTLDFKGKSVILFGEGEDKTVFKANAASTMFDMQDTVDKPLLPLAIRNMKLDGAGIATAGIKTRYRHKTDFSNVTIINVNGDCLNEIDSWNNRRTDLTLYDSINGLVLQGANHDSAYNGLSISGNSQYQIKLMGGGTVPDGSTAVSFNQCDVEYASGDGIYVDVKGLARFNDCYLGEEIGGKVFDMASGTVVVSGGFAWFGKNTTSYLGYLAGGKLFLNNVNIKGGANASVSNMFFSGAGRAFVNESPCYLIVTNAQVMHGDVLDYGGNYDCFAPKLGRQYTGFCLNGTFNSTTSDNEITVTCATSTGSPTLLEVHANVIPNWMSGAQGALVVVYKSTKDCSVRLTSGTIGVAPTIDINGTLPATATPKTAVFYNWAYTNGVYPTILEIFQDSTVPGDSLTVSEVFLTDFRHIKPDGSATFYNLAKC